MTMIVYRYGLRKPTDNLDLVHAQLRAAHSYRNTLIEIERARRVAMRALYSSVGDVAAAEQRDAEADERAALERTPEARAARREAGRALREIRAAIRAQPEILAASDLITERAAELVRNARAHCGVYWGTYLLIEDALAAMRKAPLYDDPRFVRWSGEGRLGVQVQGGAEVHEATTLLRIEPSENVRTHPYSKRSMKRKYAVLALRVGSDESGKPVWARWPMVMHRPIPVGARIKRAAVHLRMIGPREEWCVTMTLDLGAALPRGESERAPTGTLVAVDLGWRLRPDGSVRVAMTQEGEELLLAPRVLSGIERADTLRSTRDTNFDAVRPTIAAVESPHAWWPPNIGQWKSPGRLASLIIRWRDARWPGDEAAYEVAEAWRKQDKHLWLWETSQRTGALRHRREVYRIWAAQLARRFSTLVVEAFDLRDVARKESTPMVGARSMRQRVAPSEARLALVQAFRARGGEVVEVDPANTTRTCAECGSLERWDQAREVDHTCSGCGMTWDQDVNAADMIERRGTAKIATPVQAPETPVVTETRWQRAARKRTEREARKGSVTV